MRIFERITLALIQYRKFINNLSQQLKINEKKRKGNFVI